MTGEQTVTAFQAGINSVNWLLIRFGMVMAPVILLVNGFTKGNWAEAALFARSVAVGLTPEMLPMVVTSALAKGAVMLAHKQDGLRAVAVAVRLLPPDQLPYTVADEADLTLVGFIAFLDRPTQGFRRTRPAAARGPRRAGQGADRRQRTGDRTVGISFGGNFRFREHCRIFDAMSWHTARGHKSPRPPGSVWAFEGCALMRNA